MNTEIPAPNQNLLRQWQEGFWQLSQSRLHRARLLMPARQAEVLDLLPLLLHLNHPQLPGFVDYSTPAAIEFFAPTSNLMERAKTLFRSLPKASQIRHQEAAISALYLMGSLGSLAQSRQSDLDLWLCLRRPLGAEDLQKLESKCRYIERWAEQQGAELHIFIMDLEQFGQRENETLDSENCGSTQHKLLLDEFYRASILLAGKMPRWWLIPVACKTEQQAELWWHQLIEQRLVNPDHWLNPGHVSQIPEQEFLGAGLWQLSKGLKSPYKSLLKLLLYRQYAEQFPQGQPLCQDLKSLIHGGVRDSDQCDAYVLLVEKILSGLQTSEHQGRANLVRRAFYLKTGIKLSYPRRQLDDWRRQPLEQLVQQWGWSASALIDLDNQETWSVNLVVRERNALVAEMIGSYRTLVRFNQKQQTPLSIRREDIQKLGYQLTAAYDSRPGKVQNINPGIVRSLAQEAVTIIQFPGVWQLATGRCPKLPPDEKILKQAPSLIELLAFCWQNGLIQRETRLYTLSGKTPIERYELLQLSASIGRILKSAGKVASESDAWARKPCPASVHMFVNVAHDPMAALTQSGKQRVSNQTDPFCFGTQKENLVQSLDVLLSNSWGEWEVFKFPHSYPVSKQTSAPVSTQALMRWLQMLVPMLNDPHQRPDLEIHCYSQTRAAQIRTRLNELLHHLLKHLRRSDGPYLFRLGSHIAWLDQQPEVSLKLLQHETDLWPLFEQPTPGKPGIDPQLQLEAPLAALYRQCRSDAWQLFYQKTDDRLCFYLVDQTGAMLREEIHQSEIGYWMLPMLRVLNSLRIQWLIEGRADVRQLAMFELIRHTNKDTLQAEWRCLARTIPESAKSPASIELKAVFDLDDQPTLYCNMQEFSIWRWGDQLYAAVANHILSLRKSGQSYPVYLSGISFASAKTLIEHWRHKREIERSLSKAITSLQRNPGLSDHIEPREQDVGADSKRG